MLLPWGGTRTRVDGADARLHGSMSIESRAVLERIVMDSGEAGRKVDGNEAFAVEKGTVADGDEVGGWTHTCQRAASAERIFADGLDARDGDAG